MGVPIPEILKSVKTTEVSLIGSLKVMPIPSRQPLLFVPRVTALIIVGGIGSIMLKTSDVAAMDIVPLGFITRRLHVPHLASVKSKILVNVPLVETDVVVPFIVKLPQNNSACT